jgi:4-hydroxythreonine-4-phosphate dehydrogenase
VTSSGAGSPRVDPLPAPLAVSLGEPAGIGPDLALAVWAARHERPVPPFFVVGDPALLARRAATLGLAHEVAVATPASAAQLFPAALPVVPGPPMRGEPGRPVAADAPAVVAAIEAAVDAVQRGAAAAVVTLPVQKATLTAAGFAYQGHTDFLGALAERWWPGGPFTPVMMLAGPELRTVPVTVHVALAEVPRLVTAERIVAVGSIVAAELRSRFGIDRPRLAVAGLDPHAGEAGTIGSADETVVRPAVAALAARGVAAFGPLPADTLFHPGARAAYDVVLCMYHDQALIPVKTIAFEETVNVTLGLPFVRTSPDHGTALGLAGTGRADATSTRAALALAARLAAPAL